MRRSCAVILVAGFILAGCGSASEQSAESPDPSLSRELGKCESLEPDAEFFPAVEYVAGVDRWVEVDAAASQASDGVSNARRTQSHRLVAGETDRQDGTPSRQDIVVHGSLLSGREWVAENGGDFYLGLLSKRQKAIVGVVLTDDGRVAFTGECQHVALWEPMADRFGEELITVMREVVSSSANDIDSALGVDTDPETPEDEGPVILNPESAPSDVLADLRLVRVRFSIPSQWRSQATICTKIDAGWNDCFGIADRAANPEVSAYVVPDGPLEVWVLNADADANHPIQMLGAVVAPGDRDLLELTIAGDMSTDGTVSSATVEIVGL